MASCFSVHDAFTSVSSYRIKSDADRYILWDTLGSVLVLRGSKIISFLVPVLPLNGTTDTSPHLPIQAP